jgi:DNA repair protein RadA/Sms
MEAARIGFKSCIIPEGNYKLMEKIKGIEDIEIKGVKTVQQALNLIL